MRVVSLHPAITEILFALNAQDALVGVSKLCDFPEQVKEKKIVGKPDAPDFDLIEELEPDLVILLGDEQKKIKAECEKRGLNALHLTPKTLKEVFGDFIIVGEKVGCADSAKTLVNKLKAKLSQDAMKIRLLPKKLVYFEGAPSWMRDLLANVGIELVEADDVEDKNPELIFLIDPKNCKKEWKEVKAVKNNKLLPINPLVIRPGPRLVESAEALGAMVYPSHFSTFGSMMEVLDQYYKDVEPIDLKTAFEY